MEIKYKRGGAWGACGCKKEDKMIKWHTRGLMLYQYSCGHASKKWQCGKRGIMNIYRSTRMIKSKRVVLRWMIRRKKMGLLYRREKVLKAVWLAVVCGGVRGQERPSLGRWLGDCGLIRRCSRSSSQMSGYTTLAGWCCREKACNAIEQFLSLLFWSGFVQAHPYLKFHDPRIFIYAWWVFNMCIGAVVACF